jgi:hypothetical protein
LPSLFQRTSVRTGECGCSYAVAAASGAIQVGEVAVKTGYGLMP